MTVHASVAAFTASQTAAELSKTPTCARAHSKSTLRFWCLANYMQMPAWVRSSGTGSRTAGRCP